jgi:MFS family permease
MSTESMRAAPWGVLVVVAGNLLLDTIEISSIFVALPTLGADLGLTGSEQAAVASAFPLGFMAGIAVAAPVARRLGPRTLLVGALLAFAAASVLSAMADGVETLLLARLIKGVSAGLTTPIGNRVLSEAFATTRSRSRATRLYSAIGGGGFVAGLVITAPLLLLSWQAAIVWTGPVAGVLAVIALRSMRAVGDLGHVAGGPSSHDRGGFIAPPAVAAAAVSVVAALSSLPPVVRLAAVLVMSMMAVALAMAPLRSAVATPELRALALNAVTAGVFNGAFLLYFASIQHPLQASSLGTLGAWAAAPVGLGMAFAVPLTDRLTRRVRLDRLVAAAAGCAGATYLCSAVLGLPPIGWIVAGCCLIGIGFVLGFVPLNLRAVQGTGESVRAAALGSYQLVVQMGAALALPIGMVGAALVDDVTGSWPSGPALGAAGVALALAAVTGLLRRPAGRGR